MRILMIAVLMTSLSLSLPSCATWKQKDRSAAQGAETPELKGSSWTLSEIPGVELEATPKPVTLNFGEEQKVGGHAGCNGFGGTYVQDGDKLNFSELISTKMACMPGLKTENAFLDALHHTDGFIIRNDQLELQHDGVTRAILHRDDNKK